MRTAGSGTDARRRVGWCALALALLFSAASCDSFSLGAQSAGLIELDTVSRYSRIRVRRYNNIRTLSFIRDSGEEVVETMLDIQRPHHLQTEYTKFMFMNYCFQPKVEKVLIVGLGGGCMVHFLRHYDAEVKVDVVEIDPVIVQIADRYFGVRSEGNVKITTADALTYLTDTEAKYDVIYMDAFLKPARDTDGTGVPLRLKTIEFYKNIQQKLTDNGLVVFNLNPHRTVHEDLRTIAAGFPQAYVYQLPRSEGFVVVASRSATRESAAVLARRAEELDRRFQATISFRRMAVYLRPN